MFLGYFVLDHLLDKFLFFELCKHPSFLKKYLSQTMVDENSKIESNLTALNCQTKKSSTSSTTHELSKTERRRLAKKRKKERLLQEKLKSPQQFKQKKKTTKLTKSERKIKYTLRAVERRNAKTQKKKETRMICFHCRKKGHSAINCPEKATNLNSSVNAESSICYKCGSSEHRLATCPKRKNKRNSKVGSYDNEELPYATCFICNAMGHLASQCKKNTNGIYVAGGSCRECGSKAHIAADCPNRLKKLKEENIEDTTSNLISSNHGGRGDDDPGLIYEEENDSTDKTKIKAKRTKVVNF